MPLHPILLAAQYGNLEKLKAIVQEDSSSLSATDWHGRSVLHIASQHGQVKIVEYLIQQDPTFPKQSHRNSGVTALHAACHKGQLTLVKWYVQHHPDLIYCQANQGGHTPLDYARSMGREDVVEFLTKITSLLEKEKSTTTNDNNNVHCGKHNNIVFSKILTVYPTNHTQEEAPFVLDTVNGRLQLVLSNPKLLRQKQNNDDDKDGFTPLMIAAFYGYLEIAKEIVQADYNAIKDKDKKGRTPFVIACEKQHMEIAWIMIRAGPIGCLFNI